MGLTPIKDLLGTTPEASKNESKYIFCTDPAVKDLPDTPKPVPCEFCGKERLVKGFRFLPDKIFWAPYGPERCDCEQAVAAYEKEKAEQKAKEEAERKAEEERRLKERIRKIVGESGMGERFLRRTFATFEITEQNQRAAATAKRYADSFEQLLPSPGSPEPGRNGLFIAGPPGTGKTHLAAAIANDLIQRGRPVICMTMIDLLERIKRTYNEAGADEGSVLKIYKTVPLLIVDDIGKEPPTEWAISTIYNIINGRYEAYLPTIITTNYDTDALIQRMTPRDTRDDTTAKATLDRLMEMCRGVNMTGESWRRK